MQYQILGTIEEMNSIAEEWNDLLGCCSASHVPFLRHEYLNAWWQNRGGGEWPDAELLIVTGRLPGGELAGIAPMFYAKNREGIPALLLMGSIEISDYLDLIVRPDQMVNFVDGLFTLLSGVRNPAWQALDWYNIAETSPILAALQSAALQAGWSYQQETLQRSPYIPLPGDWETYLAGIDKKQRHEIRRKMRRAEEGTLPVRWYIANDPAALQSEIDGFLDLMAQDEEKNRFLTDIMRAQMRSIMQAAFQHGWLQLAFLEVNGEKAAGYLNFDYNGHIWVYNSGLNYNLRELSPGWVLLGHLLKWANENSRQEFDFMRGDEEYKYRFGAIDRYIVRATVNRND